MIKFGVVIFPGSNCDLDTIYVINKVVNQEIIKIWHNDTKLPSVDCIILPGGFSFGDYLRPGAIASRSPIMNSVKEFAENGGYVLGICNGFQILTDIGYLPGAIIANKDLRFISRFVELKVENNDTAFTNQFENGEIIKVPIAHKIGNYYTDEHTLKKLKDNKQVVLTYVNNPNGSKENIAGIINEQGNVFGLMPHPERAYDAILGSSSGKKIFESVISYLERKK
jgi:phosphoribosylformylglycinamidine synthase subunit PurQ / glutaminase